MSALSNTFRADFSDHLKEFLSSASFVVFLLGLDDCGSLVKSSGRLQSDPYISSIKTSTMIASSNSLSRGSGMPNQVDGAFVRAPCPVPSCPTCEPNSGSVLPSLSTKATRVERGRHCYDSASTGGWYRRCATFHPGLNVAMFDLLRAFRSRQSLARPDRETSDFLVVFKLQVGAAKRFRPGRCRL